MASYPSDEALSTTLSAASTASLRGVFPRGTSPPLSLSESTPTHTDYTEGTPSFTASSPSCSSDVMGEFHFSHFFLLNVFIITQSRVNFL